MEKSDLKKLRASLTVFLRRFDKCFKTRKTRKHLDVYVSGQLGPLQRKSVEPIALDAAVPVRTLQEFFSIHRWAATQMQKRVREIVAREHADMNAIGVIDETSVAKKGDRTVGIQRQYCGSTGKVDNCVVSVHLGYVVRDFRALIAADLYLPQESWIQDSSRREAAGVPPEIKFRKKWQIALELLDQSIADGIRLKWVTADEGYGETPAFLDGIEERGMKYIVEIPRSLQGWTRPGAASGRQHRRVESLWPRGGTSWDAYRIKETEKGPLVWEARVTRFIPSWEGSTGKEHWLLMARQPLTGEEKYFLSNASEETSVESMLMVAFSRWSIERLFEDSKQEIGFDHFEMRKYQAVQRHIAVSMASLLFLARETQSLKKKWI